MRFCPAVALLALALGCGGSDAGTTTPPLTVASLVGTWNLKTVNGGSLPARISTAGNTTVDVLSDFFAIDNHGSYTRVRLVRTTIDTTVRVQAKALLGTVGMSGTTLFLADTSGVAVAELTSDTVFVVTDSAAHLDYAYVRK